MQERKIPSTFKLDEPVKIWLAKKAKENDRSSNKQLNYMLKKQMMEEENAKQASTN